MVDRLPDGELEILNILWKLGKATATQIRHAQKPQRDHATVSTLLKRLITKKLVRREKAKTGREFVYEAIAKPEKTRRGLMKSFLKNTFEGSGIEMISALFQTSAPNEEEIDQLQAMLDELKSKKSNKESKGDSHE